MNPEKLAALIRESLEGCEIQPVAVRAFGPVYRVVGPVEGQIRLTLRGDRAGLVKLWFVTPPVYEDSIEHALQGSAGPIVLRALSDLPGAPAEWGGK